MVAAPIVIVRTETGVVWGLNDLALDLTGYTQEKAKTLHLEELFSAKDRGPFKDILGLAQNSNSPLFLKEGDRELRKKTGRISPVNVAIKSQEFEEGRGLVVTLEDLSEVKRQENEKRNMLEESARVSKLADIGRLAGGIAHELNNPLAIVVGYVENIDFMLSENKYNKEDLRKNLEPIQSSALRMVKIVSKMMQMIRHESTHFQNLSVSQLVRESLIILEDILASHSITLETHLEDCFIRCDSTHIEQIITNIITNACNALGEIKENRRITISVEATKELSTIRIWNNGAPIPAEVQAKIFTPFFTTKSVGEGTGLGLYLCYSIMKAHSGELAFTSNESEGTTFLLKFPRVQEAELPQNEGSLRCLVIDDDTFFRKLLVKKLNNLNFETVEARNGSEALQIVDESEKKFDLFLVDIKMPKMNGLEFVSRLKSKNSEAYVVMISGYAGDPDLRRDMSAVQANELLTKPIKNSELLGIVESVRARSVNVKVA